VPGKPETLGVGGNALIVRDAKLRERMAVRSKLPDFALVLSVVEASFHCPKCMIRSKIWEPDAWPSLDGLPSHRRDFAGAGGAAKRLKALEDENAKLKKLLAEAMLDNATLKDVAAKKW
jgi:uncharacterized protein